MANSNAHQIFEIEKVLEHCLHPEQKGEWEYKVKWKGYLYEDNTLEPEIFLLKK